MFPVCYCLHYTQIMESPKIGENYIQYFYDTDLHTILTKAEFMERSATIHDNSYIKKVVMAPSQRIVTLEHRIGEYIIHIEYSAHIVKISNAMHERIVKPHEDILSFYSPDVTMHGEIDNFWKILNDLMIDDFKEKSDVFKFENAKELKMLTINALNEVSLEYGFIRTEDHIVSVTI